MLYELHLIGGPRDGESSMAVNPYHVLHHPSDDSVYAADEAAPGCLIWQGDDERRIDLKFVGHGQQLFEQLADGLMPEAFVTDPV